MATLTSKLSLVVALIITCTCQQVVAGLRRRDTTADPSGDPIYGHTCDVKLDDTITVTKEASGPDAATFASMASAAAHVKNRTFADPYYHYFACIDERESRPIFGTPGGDFAEWLLALNVYAKMGGTVEKFSDVSALFNAYVDTLPSSRKFYLHTDDHAEELLQHAAEKALHYPFPFENITSPTPEQQLVLLDLVVVPEHNGCGHVKLMLKYPQKYGINGSLTVWALQSYFTYLWTKDQEGEKLAYLQNVHPGPHFASGIVNLVSDAFLTAACRGQPMIVPRQGGRALFVYSSEAVQTLRTHMATFFAYLLGVEPIKLVAQMNALSTQGINVTVANLAADLPLYTVTVKPSATTTPEAATQTDFEKLQQQLFWPLVIASGALFFLVVVFLLRCCLCARCCVPRAKNTLEDDLLMSDPEMGAARAAHSRGGVAMQTVN